ncbi:MAG: glycosyl transferase [Planctomycetaceae bacterium]|nr:glycosyl transferase [Planctomycetaceae bacterium]
MRPTDSVKQIICIKWGVRYSADYVNRLYAMTARHTSPPFQMYCFTDDSAGIRSEIACRPLPELGCPVPASSPGKWKKIALWSRSLGDVTGTVLFIDLDSIITGSLDDFFTFGQPDDVILARNWVKPLQRLGQTSVFRFTVGAHPYLLEDFRRNPEYFAGTCHFEQHYVTRHVRTGVKFWPNPWVRHFRLHCLGAWPLRYVRPAVLPVGARIVTFPGGNCDPADISAGHLTGFATPEAPLTHLRSTIFSHHLSLKQKYNRIKNYMLPVPWVVEHWRE